jgi:nucleoid-associated protein YejK
MKFKIGEWGGYKENVMATTDTEKFDDMLRMVISLNYEQIRLLEIYLERKYKEKRLVYGIHKADSALMTCLVFQRHGRQIHFVDSANGGYAVAAKMLKEKMKERGF